MEPNRGSNEPFETFSLAVVAWLFLHGFRVERIEADPTDEHRCQFVFSPQARVVAEGYYRNEPAPGKSLIRAYRDATSMAKQGPRGR